MEVAIPVTGNTVDCYEDMFKEITRKLYGEDGLSDITSNDRLPPPQDRCLTPVDYETDGPLLKSDDHLTAFGLAALMQNGFPSNGIFNTTFQQHKPNQNFEEKWIISDDDLQWTRSKIASYNPAQKLFRCVECDCVGYLPRVAEHWLGTHSNLRTFRCPQCPYESAWARCVRLHLTRQHNISTEETTDVLLKNNPVLHEISRYLQRLKSRLDINTGKSASINNGTDDYHAPSSSIPSTSGTMGTGRASSTSSSQNTINNDSGNISTPNKRYSCSFCPYATDRRDLFTRHENIHREEKPFQCYVCQKQFNRADHVKKHFLRMHREHPYDLNRIRRHPPKNASGMSFYNRYNSNEISSSHSSEPTSNDVVSLTSSLTIPNGLCNIAKTISGKQFGNLDSKCSPNIKNCNLGKSISKKKGDKRFSCCYCSWTGVDNWCLKRHMNTHLKPFVCGLCDYKAARSERLATHVLKVHNKRACGKCSFLADDPAQLIIHQQDHHPFDQRNNRSHSIRSYPYSGNNSSNGLTNNTNNANANSVNPCIASLSNNQSMNKSYDAGSAATLMQHSTRLLQHDTNKSWKQNAPKQHGAARLFNYMEASDSSEPESDSKGPEETSRISITQRINSDFPEAGDVGHLKGTKESEKEEVELPLFVCKNCGCEFEDDASLETHKFIKCYSPTSPAKQPEETKENVNPKLKYQCQVCTETFYSQFSVMFHMSTHSMLYIQHSSNDLVQEKENHKRSRKQTKPKKVVSPTMDNKEDTQYNNSFKKRLCEKYMLQFLQRRRFSCTLCRTPKLSQFRTKSKLVLHQFWRHGKNKFQCEHCKLRFRHRYQVVLHSSSVHTTKFQDKIQLNYKNQELASAKEINGNESSVVPVPHDISHGYVNHSYITTVPDITNSSTPVHKLGVSFLDHTFLHTNPNLNSHMPIIIPTFPPC